MVGRSVAMQRQEWAGQAMEKGERSVEREVGRQRSNHVRSGWYQSKAEMEEDPHPRGQVQGEGQSMGKEALTSPAS
ncbi:hypothetical protein BHE74_00038770 [Ensete ventricosum]|nr:hypothetical protein BHE74_00038770 [Ensete ventricosum]